MIECGAVPVDLAALRAADPALVTVSITAFGSSGPKAAWPATDLTVNAAGCQLAMTGDDDRPPVRTAVPAGRSSTPAPTPPSGRCWRCAERGVSGRGQHVEVSAQRSMLQATQSYVLGGPARRGGGAADERRGQDRRARHPAAAGRARTASSRSRSCSARRSGRSRRRLMEWIHEEGYCDEATRDKDWLDYANQL